MAYSRLADNIKDLSNYTISANGYNTNNPSGSYTNVADDNSNTHFETTIATPRWFKIQLDKVFNIRKYALYFGSTTTSASPQGWDCYYSTDGVTFSLLHTISGQSWQSYEQKEWSVNVNAKYIVLDNIISNGYATAAITEFQLATAYWTRFSKRNGVAISTVNKINGITKTTFGKVNGISVNA